MSLDPALARLQAFLFLRRSGLRCLLSPLGDSPAAHGCSTVSTSPCHGKRMRRPVALCACLLGSVCLLVATHGTTAWQPHHCQPVLPALWDSAQPPAREAFWLLLALVLSSGFMSLPGEEVVALQQCDGQAGTMADLPVSGTAQMTPSSEGSTCLPPGPPPHRCEPGGAVGFHLCRC